MQIIGDIGGALSGKTLFIEGDCLFARQILIQETDCRALSSKRQVIKNGKMDLKVWMNIKIELLEEMRKAGQLWTSK